MPARPDSSDDREAGPAAASRRGQQLVPEASIDTDSRPRRPEAVPSADDLRAHATTAVSDGIAAYLRADESATSAPTPTRRQLEILDVGVRRHMLRLEGIAPFGPTISAPASTAHYRAVRAQLEVLSARHAFAAIVTARVLIEHSQLAAADAKCGRLAAATATMDEIGAHLPRPDRELTAVVRAEALPVLALLRFHDGDHDTAERRLRAALDTCHRLGSEYGHRYLTGKQLHFAVNIARCRTARGDLDGAAALLERVAAVAKGTRARWPFSDGSTLAVPLLGRADAVIADLIRREYARLPAGASEFH
ncbi:tetratricopeptide repeat protein [Nocardia sp. NPDC051929]|uniref:tetratricopeptide repeat protein n=1 Tax=unclassified Nocardia TaxID=2637762 RepID=UPI00342688F5